MALVFGINPESALLVCHPGRGDGKLSDKLSDLRRWRLDSTAERWKHVLASFNQR